MNKEQILKIVKDGFSHGVIKLSDIQNVWTSTGANTASPVSSSRNTLVSKVLYALGGVIALIGLVVLVSDNWLQLGTFGRLVITLGFSSATFIGAVVLDQKKTQGALVEIFFLLSAVVAPIAAYVLLDSAGVLDPFVVTNQVFVGLVLTLIYGVALYVTRRHILHIIVGLMFSWTYYAVVAKMIRNIGSAGYIGGDTIRDITVYTSMILGFAFLSYSLWLKNLLRKEFSISLRRVTTIYNVAAFILVLMPALFLTGVWDFVYAFLVIGAVVLSVHLKTTSGLIISAAAIGFYIIHMSAKYFSHSIGWAMVLVIAGFAIIGVGYLTYYLNRKYIAKA